MRTGGRGNLRIEKAGLLSQTHKDTLPESGVWDLGEIVLHPAMVLEGRVVDVRGAGIPGVRILPLEQSQGGFFLAIDGNVQGQAETGPDGSFRLDTLKPGAWRVHLKAPVHRDRVLTGEMPTGLYQGGLLWTLEDGLTLRGAVEGMPEQAPSDLWVRANIEGGGSAAEALGDAAAGMAVGASHFPVGVDGTFELRGLHPNARYRLGVIQGKDKDEFWMSQGAYLSDPLVVDSNAGTVRLQWRSASGLRMKVVDAVTRQPLADFKVMPAEWDEWEAFDEASNAPHPGGSFEVLQLARYDRKLKVEVRADGYDTHTIPDIQPVKGSVVDLGTVALQPAPRLQVLVKAAGTGLPVKGATVKVRTGQALPQFDVIDSPFDARTFSAETGEDGIAQVQFERGRDCQVGVTHKDFARLKLEGVDPLAHGAAPLVAELFAGGGFLVTVKDADGKPVAGRQVHCGNPKQGEQGNQIRVAVGGAIGGEDSLQQTTNAQGIVRFEHLNPGDYRLWLGKPAQTAEGFGVVFANFDDRVPAGASRATILEGETTEVEIVAPTLARLTGVLREDGAGLAGAVISLREEKSGGSGEMGADMALSMMMGGGPSGRTDANGAYELTGVEPGAYIATVTHPDRAMPAEYALDIVPGENTFTEDLVVAVVAGRVLDAEGHPVPGLKVRAEKKQATTTRTMVSIAIMGGDGGTMVLGSGTEGDRRPVVTDELGRFRLRGVLAGEPIVIIAAGGDYEDAKSEPLTIPIGAHREGIELVARRGGQLVVTVLNDAGEPARHVVLRAELLPEENSEEGETPPSPKSQNTTVTDERGQAKFKNLAPGKWRVSQVGTARIGLEDGETSTAQPREVEVKKGEVTEVTLEP
ncbi:MAG: hypothetical protein R3E96_07360 [Planctomycetota bacterium]